MVFFVVAWFGPWFTDVLVEHSLAEFAAPIFWLFLQSALFTLSLRSMARRFDVQGKGNGGLLQLIMEFRVTALLLACPLSDGWNISLLRDCGALLTCIWGASTEVVFGGCGSFRRGLGFASRPIITDYLLSSASAALAASY
jgi:hypothetical protein